MGKVCRKAWREDVGGRNLGRRRAAAAVGEKGGMSVRYEGSSGTAAGGLRRTWTRDGAGHWRDLKEEHRTALAHATAGVRRVVHPN